MTVFGDYCNRLYLSDNKIDGTIDISNPEWPSKIVGEYPAWLWLSNNIRECDFASLSHYRRKLPLSIAHVVLPFPMLFKCTILEQVAYYHSPILAEAIVKTLNPTELAIMNDNKLMCWNIFKAPQPLIKQWCEYCGNKLKQLSDILKCPIDIDSVHKFVKTKSNGFLTPYEGKNVDLVYQSRFFACALERYSHCFWTMYQGPKDFKQVKFLEPGQTI